MCTKNVDIQLQTHTHTHPSHAYTIAQFIKLFVEFCMYCTVYTELVGLFTFDTPVSLYAKKFASQTIDQFKINFKWTKYFHLSLNFSISPSCCRFDLVWFAIF